MSENSGREVACWGGGSLAVVSLNAALGGIVWGIGLRLLERADIDLLYGSTVNNNLAVYHVSAQTDVRIIETHRCL